MADPAAALARTLFRGAPASILCFHAVSSPALPSHSVVNLPADTFTALMDRVRAVATVVPLRELLDRREAGRSVRGLVAVTFDDGYASLPALIGTYLAAHGVPATIFIASAYSGTGGRFWWDRVDDLYPVVPAERWRAFEDAVGVPEAYRTGQPAAFGPLRPLRQWLLRSGCGRTTPPLDAALTDLERDAGQATRQHAMTFDALRRFAAQAPVDFGVHTDTHPVLPLLAEPEARGEIERCHAVLREELGAEAVVPVLAAPFGLYDAAVLRVARAAGMRATLTLANRTLAAAGAETGLPRLSMTVRSTGWRVLVHASGLRERVAGRGRVPRHPPPPDLPTATT